MELNKVVLLELIKVALLVELIKVALLELIIHGKMEKIGSVVGVSIYPKMHCTILRLHYHHCTILL